jgi:hypothetical protein
VLRSILRRPLHRQLLAPHLWRRVLRRNHILRRRRRRRRRRRVVRGIRAGVRPTVTLPLDHHRERRPSASRGAARRRRSTCRGRRSLCGAWCWGRAGGARRWCRGRNNDLLLLSIREHNVLHSAGCRCRRRRWRQGFSRWRQQSRSASRRRHLRRNRRGASGDDHLLRAAIWSHDLLHDACRRCRAGWGLGAKLIWQLPIAPDTRRGAPPVAVDPIVDPGVATASPCRGWLRRYCPPIAESVSRGVRGRAISTLLVKISFRNLLSQTFMDKML